MMDKGEEVVSASGGASHSKQLLVVPREIVYQTHHYFVPYWQSRVEAACFWFGIAGSEVQVVTTIAIPRLRQSWGNYQVEVESLRCLAADMRAQGLTNLCQVHSHPTARVDHSPYDDEHAYSTREGALSLVWPNYGATLHHGLDGIGVHERRSGNWVRLQGKDATRRIRLVDSQVDYRWGVNLVGKRDGH